jgi:uncharacterized repeat protein (TIGR01451 family)
MTVSKARDVIEARETMGTKGAGNSMKANHRAKAGLKAAFAACFTAMLMIVVLTPAAHAAKIDNPSPPNFRAEVTGGFLQFVGSAGTPLQLPLDFATFDPPLPNPTLTGSITTNAQRNGVINVPQSGIVFPPIPIDVDGISLTVRLLPVAAATGFIDPLSGRVDLNVPIRLKAEGSALGQSLGDNCYIGSAGSPINLGTTTHNGAFPSTSGGVYVADFVAADGFTGGWLASEPYSDEASSWALNPKLVPGKPVGGANGKPLPSEIPYNELTEFIPRAAGAWRGMNETLAAPAAAGCGTGLAAGIVNGQVNDLIGLPSTAGSSTASLDFKFNVFSERPAAANAIVQKAVKSRFVASGVSASPWLATQTPTAVSAQAVSIDATTSYFKVGGNATERYAFDFGTGTFGPWTTNPVSGFTAPTLAEGATPVVLPIRVKVKDTDGDEDITTRRLRVVPATDITIDANYSSVAGSKFRAGSSGNVLIDVTNQSDDDSSSQSIAFTANLPAGVTLTNLGRPAGWSCTSGPSSVSCSLPQAGLAANATDQFNLAVDVATGASNPSTVTASATMSGDPAPSNNSLSDPVEVVKTDLALSLTRTSSLVANGWTPYEVQVENVGDGLTVGATTVDVALPPDFSYRVTGSGGTGWSCATPVDARNVVCTRSASLAGATSAPLLTVVAKVDRNAAAIPSTVTATVSTQGDVDAANGSNSDDDTDTVNIQPEVSVDTEIPSNFKVGDSGTVTFAAVNGSVVPLDGPTTISSTLPAGLTVSAISGPGWDCSATVLGSSDVSCEFAGTVAGGDNSPLLTATVSVAQAAYPATTVTSTVTNANDAFGLNNSDSADVVVRRLDVAIQKIAVKPFNVGIEGRYRLNVTNVGDAATVGTITVTDTLPAGLLLKGASGAGWNCGASTIGGSSVNCTLNGLLGPGVQAAPIELRVDVLNAAAEAGSVSNTAFVDTPRDTRGVPADAAITDNNTSTIETPAVAVDLSVESTHPGNFRVMTEDVYSLTVRNVGFFGTDAGQPVTVTNDLPAGILPIIDEIEITRPGWSCVASGSDVVCTLQAPSPTQAAMEPESAVTIDIPVAVTDGAADQSDNVATVSTARDSNPVLSPNNRSVDPTTVTRIDLSVAAQASIVSRAGGIGEVNVDLQNIGSAATAAPSTVVIPLATGTSYRATGSTVAGWQCSSPGPATQVTCSRTPQISAGGAAPPLKVRTNVTTAAPNQWSTTVTVSTDGEPAERLANNESTFSQTLEKVDLAVSKSHEPLGIQAGKRSQFTIEVSNVGNTASTGSIRVDDPVDSTFLNLAAAGPGWTCSTAGGALSCTRPGSLAAGASAPPITVSFDVPTDAAGTRDSTATVSNASDPYPSNNSDNDPILIVASADASVSIDQPGSMRVGDQVNVAYTVTNSGTEATSGSPGVSLKVSTSDGLDPTGFNSDDSWDCSISPAVEDDAAFLDCVLADELPPGGSSVLNANFDVIPSGDSQTATAARVSTPGDVNRSNDFDFQTSNLSGLDLELSVVPAPAQTAHLEAGVTSSRRLTVTNVGTSATTSPVSVKVPLPDGVQWDDSVPRAGWSCAQTGREVNCSRGATMQPLASVTLDLGIRPARSNAPEVAVSYLVQTEGDENADNNTATRNEEVRYIPETTITSGPPATTEAKTASVVFTSDDATATFECKVDNGVFGPCSSPLELSDLTIGQHSVSVRAVNANAMTDQTPAVATWTINSRVPSGESKPVKATLTGGSLSLAALGSVPLPADQISLRGSLFESGDFIVPMEGVQFEPVVQSIPDVLGPGTNVDVTISISATGDGAGKLPTGGGAADFVLPVRADVQAKLGTISVIPPGTECALKPVTFNLAGSYDESAGTVSLSSPTVGFPQVTGCGSFQATIDSLLELPRNDIAIDLDFALADDGCPAGQVGTPPNCSVAAPKLAKLKKKGPRSVRAGKPVVIRTTVGNAGTARATRIEVCIKSPVRFIKGKASRCTIVRNVDPNKSKVATFRLSSKQGQKGRARFRISAEVKAPVPTGASKKQYVGHVTLMR